MKKNNMKVIQINGFRGILITLFIISCLIAGFIAFPAFLSMCAWNALAIRVSSVPNISFLGGLLLWGIVAMSFIIFNKKKFIVSLKVPEQELSDDELKQVLTKIQSTDFSNLTNDLKNINDSLEKKETEENNK